MKMKLMNKKKNSLNTKRDSKRVKARAKKDSKKRISRWMMLNCKK
jgi:hypothetical protein